AGDGSRMIYYRIRETDMSGNGLLSNIASVIQTVRFVKLMVTPNPAMETATLSFISDYNTDVSIRLMDISGHSVWHRQYQAGTGMNTLMLEHLQELPDGIYLLQLYDGKNYENIKMSIRHYIGASGRKNEELL
ncbi:MAG: T9SS type A sorting domain-containing protein, partial [Chitinophaga rupis]